MKAVKSDHHNMHNDAMQVECRKHSLPTLHRIPSAIVIIIIPSAIVIIIIPSAIVNSISMSIVDYSKAFHNNAGTVKLQEDTWEWRTDGVTLK